MSEPGKLRMPNIRLDSAECHSVEIAPDYIAITVRPAHPLNVKRINNALWPTAIIQSTHASLTAFWELQVEKVKGLLKDHENDSQGKPRFPPGFADVQRLQGSEAKNVPTGKRPILQETSVGTKATERGAKGPDLGLLSMLPGIPQPDSDMSKIAAIWKHTLAETWKSPREPMPRGSFIISGLVEIAGSRAKCTVDVVAVYDPQDSQWLNIGLAVRRIQERKQAPRGGPGERSPAVAE